MYNYDYAYDFSAFQSIMPAQLNVRVGLCRPVKISKLFFYTAFV